MFCSIPHKISPVIEYDCIHQFLCNKWKFAKGFCQLNGYQGHIYFPTREPVLDLTLRLC